MVVSFLVCRGGAGATPGYAGRAGVSCPAAWREIRVSLIADSLSLCRLLLPATRASRSSSRSWLSSQNRWSRASHVVTSRSGPACQAAEPGGRPPRPETTRACSSTFSAGDRRLGHGERRGELRRSPRRRPAGSRSPAGSVASPKTRLSRSAAIYNHLLLKLDGYRLHHRPPAVNVRRTRKPPAPAGTPAAAGNRHQGRPHGGPGTWAGSDKMPSEPSCPRLPDLLVVSAGQDDGAAHTHRRRR